MTTFTNCSSDNNVNRAGCGTGSDVPLYYSWDDVCHNEGINQMQQQKIFILHEDGDDSKEMEFQKFYHDYFEFDGDDTNNSSNSHRPKKCKILRILDIRRRRNDNDDSATNYYQRIFKNDDIKFFETCKENEFLQEPMIDSMITLNLQDVDDYIAIKIVRIPINELYERRFELPPRHVEFSVLIDNNCHKSDNNISSSDLYDLQLVQYILLGSNIIRCIGNDVERSNKNNSSEPVKQGCLPQYDSNILLPLENNLDIQPTNKPWHVSFIFMLSHPSVDGKHSKVYNEDEEKENNEEEAREEKGHPCDKNQSGHFSETVPFCMKNRFWKPDPMIQHVLAPFLSQQLLLNQQLENHDQYHPERITPLEILDLGAGIGRDVCYLAEFLKMTLIGNQLDISSSIRRANSVREITMTKNEFEPFDSKNYISLSNHKQSEKVSSSNSCQNLAVTTIQPFRVIANDQRYREEKYTDVTTQFWERYNVSDVTRCRLWNWKNTVVRCYSDDSYDDGTINTIQQLQRMLQNTNSATSVLCIYAVRFWNRQLFEAIALLPNKPKNLVVAISHFGKPTVGSKWTFVHPKEKNVLEREELKELFSTSDSNNLCNDSNNVGTTGSDSSGQWEIIHDRVVYENGAEWIEADSVVDSCHVNATQQRNEHDRKNCHQRTLIQFVAQWTS